MPGLDAPATAHLDSLAPVRPAFFAWLDFLGDPIRATTAGHDVTIAASGDSELDGAYLGVDPQVVSVGDVTNREGGSETLTVSLSGLLLPDAELLATIANRANWQGRVARLWVQVRDETATAVGAIAPYYTGYMSSLEILPSPEMQTIQLRIENYLATLSEASNRSYLNQNYYDAADVSASGTISAANNARAGQGAGAGYGDGGGGGGGGGGGLFGGLGLDNANSSL